jgi:hypothetical protein
MILTLDLTKKVTEAENALVAKLQVAVLTNDMGEVERLLQNETIKKLFKRGVLEEIMIDASSLTDRQVAQWAHAEILTLRAEVERLERIVKDLARSVDTGKWVAHVLEQQHRDQKAPLRGMRPSLAIDNTEGEA